MHYTVYARRNMRVFQYWLVIKVVDAIIGPVNMDVS